MALIDMEGKTCGRLTVVGPAADRKPGFWVCDCTCGATGLVVSGKKLRNGHTQSCGCLKRDRAIAANTKALPTYNGVHSRLFRTRGPARLHACIDCGERAQDWSYQGNDPNELIGYCKLWLLRYSTKLEYYFPRCKPCHSAHDRAEQIKRTAAAR